MDLGCNSFTCVPSAISAATGLTSLVLSCNRHLSLCEVGAATLLTLQRLQRLEMLMIKAVDSTHVHNLQQLLGMRCVYYEFGARPPVSRQSVANRLLHLCTSFM